MAPQNWRRWCWALVVFLLALPSPPAADAANVTNEDIRDAIVSLVHLYRQTEGQLSRHEFREKALGEHLKKSLIGLDKKVRPLEPLKGMISRLDERLSNVETILLQKEEREKGNHKKTSDALEAIQKSLQEIRAGGAASQLEGKLDAVKQDVDSLKSSLSKESLRAACAGSEASPLEKHLSEAEKLLNKYEVKLSEYNGSRVQTDIVPLSDVTMQDDACKITEAIERQEKEIKKVQQILSDSETSLKDLPSKEDLRSAHNETLASLQAVAEAARQGDEKVVQELTTKLRDMGDRLVATNEDIQRSLTQSNIMNDQATADILKNYDALKSELKLLSKNDNVLIQTADNVLATKKRVEYGVHQILLEVGELVREQGQSVNRSIAERFEAIEATLVAAQSLAIGNMSSRVESEMSQVWRQIGIMHTQLTAAKLVLDNVNNRTEQYVKGSGSSLDKIKDKVSGIKFRMGEVDESLQYLLGRLSLVTQEFNRVRDGLGEALRQAHLNFKQVREKLPDAPSGFGPHEIPKADVRSENEA